MNNKTKENINLIKDQFKNYAKAIILEGSFAIDNYDSWSDLDFEVVIENFYDLKNLHPKPEMKCYFEDIDRCLDIVSSSQGIDIIQIKHELKGIKTGIRFIRKSVFEQITRLDFNKINKDIYLLSIRAGYKKDQTLYYKQRNFFGEYLTIEKKYWLINGFQFTLVPVVLLNNNGRLYPGSMLDRYLTFCRLIFDTEKIAENCLGIMKTSLCKRYFKELENRSFSGNGGVFHCLSRWDNFPKTIKVKLVELEDKIYKSTDTYD